jgi:serine/threonine protein kinase
MELLGCSLEDRMRGSAAGRLQPTTVALIAQQAISRIEYIHSKGFVHGDIKPENFMFGVGPKAHHLYMIDFGLSKRYYKDGSHVPMKTYKGLQGTMRYASINAHLGMEYSRRDDLEAIGHMMLYFLGGRLPWSGLPAKNTEEQIKVVGQKKVDVPLEALCAGFPDAFETYLRLTRMIAFQERPAYSLFRELFTEARQQLGPLEDHHFEWNEGKDMGHLEPLEDARPIRQPDEDSSDDPRRFPTIAKPRKRDLIRSMLGMPKPAL